MPFFYYFLSWFILVFGHVVISPRLAIGPIYPDVMLASTILIGIVKGWNKGLWFGFAIGLSIDLIDPQNYGWTTMLVSLSGYFAGMVREKIFIDHIVYQSSIVFGITLCYHLLYRLINWPLYFIDNLLQAISNSVFISLYTFVISLLALFIISQRSRLKDLL